MRRFEFATAHRVIFGPGTVRELNAQLRRRGRRWAYTTVLTLLQRLEAKSYVRRDRSASVHVFAAAVGRDELIGRRLRTIADKLCGGSLTPLLSHLLQSGPLSPAERQSLRQLIEDLDTRGRPPSRPARAPKPRG